MAFHWDEIEGLSGRERQERGRALLGLASGAVSRAVGDRHLTTLRPGRATARLGRSSIARGDLVRLAPEEDPGHELVVATVWSIGATLTVATEVPLRLPRAALRADLWAQDTTFRRMEAALDDLAAPSGRRWRERLFARAPRSSRAAAGEPPADLDPSQAAAWRAATSARDLALVQGPPGTGKTTTATAIAASRLALGDRVLLAAPTNVAADNLALGLLGRGVEGVVRVGHPARAHPDLAPVLLDSLVDEEGGSSLAGLRARVRESIAKRDAGDRPRPAIRRGLSDDAILRLARQGKGIRGVTASQVAGMAEWIKGRKDTGNALDRLREEEGALADRVLGRSRAVVATASTAGGEILSGRAFDLCILDEAAQAPTPLALIPMLLAGRAVLVGDERQLPPVIRAEEALGLGLGDTLFEELVDRWPRAVSLLTVQYRMREEIMAFSNRRWYGGALRAAEGVGERQLPRLDPPADHDPVDQALAESALVGLDTAGRHPEEMRPGETSWRNPGEAEIVARLVRRLLGRGLPADDLGVIVPYRAQRKALRAALEDTGVEVHTVDGFQGREKTVIVLGLVRSNPRGEVGFLLDERRLNVALTRARTRFFLVGDRATTATTPLYRALWQHLESAGRVLAAP